MFKAVLQKSFKAPNVSRHLSVSARQCAALVFNMPAMSPTMTEGGITSWKLKPGEEFAAGDVLLEVETDKATIDVEAQDDGILWEILVNEGESGIPVGKPIAFLAEPGDDLATLEKPSVEAPKEQKQSEPPAESKSETPKPAKSESPKSTATGVFAKADPQQKLLPSVQLLLHKHHISEEEALAKIEASGPKGRLLAGDVLAYVGEIEKTAVASIAEFINHRLHLDLSNVKAAASAPAAPEPQEAAKEAAKEVQKPRNILTLRLSAKLDVPKDQFKYAFETLLHNAITKTYAARSPEYAFSPSGVKVLSQNPDDIFDDLMAPAPTKSRFEVYDISYKFPASHPSALFAPLDAFDDLMSVPKAAPETSDSEHVNVEFKVKFDDKLVDSLEFVEYFQDSLLEQVPSKQLVVNS